MAESILKPESPKDAQFLKEAMEACLGGISVRHEGLQRVLGLLRPTGENMPGSALTDEKTARVLEARAQLIDAVETVRLEIEGIETKAQEREIDLLSSLL